MTTSEIDTGTTSLPPTQDARADGWEVPPPGSRRLVTARSEVPVWIDETKCIEGCNLCVEVCPLDALAIDPQTGKAYMHVDECWYCGPCADRCPTGAVTVNIPYLLR